MTRAQAHRSPHRIFANHGQPEGLSVADLHACTCTDLSSPPGADFEVVCSHAPTSRWVLRLGSARSPSGRDRNLDSSVCGRRRGKGRLSQAGIGADGSSPVGSLPGEVGVVAAEVAVRRGLGVDRTVQLQVVAEGSRAQIKVLADQLHDPSLGDVLGAERLNEQGERAGHADGVGNPS